MVDTSDQAMHDEILRRLSIDPLMAMEAAENGLFSSLETMAGSPDAAQKWVVKIVRMLCSYFSRWERERSQSSPDAELSKDKFVNGCLYVIEALLRTCRLGKKAIAILASTWPSITAWAEHVYEDIYVRENPEIRGGWRQCFQWICYIADKVDERSSNICLTAKLCRIVVEFWIGVEDHSFSRTLWLCCKAHGNSPYPTHFLGELGFSPERAVELAIDHLGHSINDYVRNTSPTWDNIVSCIYGLSAFSNSPDPAFRAAMIRKNAFSLLTRLIRHFRLRDAPANARRKRCTFRIHALIAFLTGFMERLPSENTIRCLSQALRKGLVEVILSTILTASKFQLTEKEKIGIDYLRLKLFSHIPCFFHEKSIVAAAGQGMVSIKQDMERKLSASSLQPEWSEFEQLLLERFILFRMNCYVRKTEEYECSNPTCKIVRPGTHMRKCATCRAAFYCSTTCQRNHWRKDNHKATCIKKGVEDKHYIQSIASNSVLRHIPGLIDLSRKKLQGIVPRYVGFIVSLLEDPVILDVVDLRDRRNWVSGYEHIYEFVLREAEKPEGADLDLPIMCVKARFQPCGGPVAEVVFAERYPTHPSRFKDCNCRSSSASTASEETLASCHNQLHSIVDAVRETMQVSGPQLNQGFWTAAVVDKCITEVDEKYGTSRDITGHAISHLSL